MAASAQAFGLADVAERARVLAQQPWKPPTTTREPALLDLSYDEYRALRFDPAQSTWRGAGLPFELQYFHVGRGFAHPVQLHEIQGGRATPLRIPDNAFGRQAKGAPAGTAPAAEIAGFRVHYPINRPDYKDEVIAFLGASYFRAVGAGQHYGLSARGLAVDITGGQGEEFPAFTAFWLERPAADAKALTFYALLDGPRVAGAYRFDVKPDAATVVDVRAVLYLRAPVAALGIAPLTSMFYAGENQPVPGDFRPEVHDSDGLQVHSASGEWLWRPLHNPGTPFATSFVLPGLRGFGLMQRDRAFSSYEDTEAQYERRPSVWVEPLGDWGPGRVELLQFHTVDETNDNVVASWVPQQLPAPGQPLELAWRLHWQGTDATRPPGAWVTQTRLGRGFEALGPEELQYVVDFDGPALQALAADAPVQAVVSAPAGAKVLFVNAYRHPQTGGWRMTLRLQRLARTQPVELRAYLQLGTQVLSETWSHAIPPQ
ncbi:glucan biosynthesis protein [Azohydromonas caseinilytica]|nr:glucan biosynthesis protein G [Azohydromonas caseinilytica]